jgi:hypothetical protein
MALKKTYIYKVYSSANVYIKTWSGPDVASELGFSQDLNSPGTEVAVVLNRVADSFGEGTDIDLGNRVKIYVVDNDLPNGQLIFQGFISNYQPVYGPNEHVEVTLLGFGAELDNYVIELGESTYLSQNSTNETEYIGMDDSLGVTPNQAIAQTVQFTENVTISAIEILQARGTTSVHSPVTIRCDVYASDVTASSPFSSGSPVLSGAIATKTLTTQDVSATALKFLFDTAFTIPANTAYSFVFTIPESARPAYGYDAVTLSRSSLNSYANGAFLKASETGTGRFSAIANRDLWFNLYKTSGNSTSPFVSRDPGAIMRSIMDDYISKGGTLSYDASTIELTGTTVSYTFNTNTTLEGIKKCLEMAPAGWYWYVDQATNMVHFHKKTSTLEHKFTLGKDITSLVPQRRIEDIVNTIYFTGASTLTPRKYTRTASVTAYGTKLMRYIDQRITVAATADTIAQSILDNRAAPEARVEIEVADSNAQSLGYDIESVTVGDIVGFRAVEAYDSNLWDVAQWDVAMWDYNVKQLGTLILQIVRLEYSPGSLKLFLSTTPPDVNKRIEDINRALTASQTANNAATPTGVVI